jgi:hypothetical protein
MARYDSDHVNQPGQYPTTAWGEMDLPEQSFGSGAAGSRPPSDALDAGSTNEPGQYPARDDFTGVPYSLGGASGSGAPGTAGIARDGTGGSDSVAYQLPTFYKGQRDEAHYDGENDSGYVQDTVQAQVSGDGDWTQANPEGYNAPDRYQMPGTAGNTPTPGSGRYQTDDGNSSGHVMYGGFLNGQRPSTNRHPSFSGPGT